MYTLRSFLYPFQGGHCVFSRTICTLGLGLFFALWSQGAGAENFVFDNVRLAQLQTENVCAITFDDGPGAHTATLLDILRERGIHATFFIVGEQAERRKDVVRRMFAEGHDVANHTYNHVSLRRLSPEEQNEQISRTDELIRSLGGEPKFFRPPYGRYNTSTLGITDAHGLTLVLWSADSQDWRKHNDLRKETVRNDALWLQKSVTAPRGVFLFHDTHKRTVEAIPAILDRMSSAGCRFVTISEYLEILAKERTSITAQAKAKNTAPAAVPPPCIAEPPAATVPAPPVEVPPAHIEESVS